MTYRECPPPAGLGSIVECVWTRIVPNHSFCEANGELVVPLPAAGPHTVLPDGAMDIIATMHPDGSLDDAFVVGAMTSPIESTMSSQSLVGIRFLPGAGGSVLNIDAGELTDQQCALRDLLPAKAPVFDSLRMLIAEPDAARALREVTVSLGVEKRSVPSLVRAATRMLAEVPNRVRVDHVAQQLRVSRQHLSRTFSAHSGLSPKQFATICRVRALLADVRDASSVAEGATRSSRGRKSDASVGIASVAGIQWSAVAAHYGYADQSHLIADVRAVTGFTPAAWERAQGSIIPIAPVPVGAL